MRTRMISGTRLILAILALAPAVGGSWTAPRTLAEETPTPVPQPVLIDHGDRTMLIDSAYGWSVSWDTDFWADDFPDLYVNPGALVTKSRHSLGEHPTGDVAIFRIMQIDDSANSVIDHSYYTFEDSRECIDFESQQFGGQPWFAPIEVREGPDGKLMSERTPDRTWAITQRVGGDEMYIDDVEYIECRTLESGSSYLFISVSAPNVEAFELLRPELEMILDSITALGSTATPTTMHRLSSDAT